MKKTMLIAAVVLLALTACGSSPTVTQAPPAAPTVTVTAPAAETETPTPEPDTDAIAQSYMDHIAEFSDVNDAIQTSINDFDMDALILACLRLSVFGDDGLQLPSINIGETDLHWDKAMNYYKQAGIACSEGADSMNVKKIEKAGDLLSKGAAEISRATDSLNSANG